MLSFEYLDQQQITTVQLVSDQGRPKLGAKPLHEEQEERVGPGIPPPHLCPSEPHLILAPVDVQGAGQEVRNAEWGVHVVL